MMNIVSYSKDELKEIYETKKAIFNDLNNIWQTSSLKSISVTMVMAGLHNYNYPSDTVDFIINEEGVKINSNSFFSSRTFYFGKISVVGNLIPYKRISQEDVLFLKNYEKLRITLLNIIEKEEKDKVGNIEILKGLRNKFTEKIVVNFNMPEAINENLIPVKEENGKRIGTIDFGDHAIELVTTSEISLIKQEPKAEKQKSKTRKS